MQITLGCPATISTMTTFVLPFEKMHGLGNDFVMVERRHLPNNINDSKLAKVLCNRNFGIGADGLIIVDYSASGNSDFKWDYFNIDGSVAEMCGNGMRCFAKYVFERGFTDNLSFSVETKAGIIIPTIEPDATVTVDMGVPVFYDSLSQELNIDSKMINYTYIEVGNPHVVIFKDKEITDNEFFDLGPKIEKHHKFPNYTNVEFVSIINRTELKCRVWERGCGPTLACGTGACAALVAANINGLVDNKASIYLPGGSLNVNWDKLTNHVYLNGTATFVYVGQFNLDLKLICNVQNVQKVDA